MANIILSTTDRTPRGQRAIICKLLQRPAGATAQQIKAATDGVNLHSMPSLTIIADLYGFDLSYTDAADHDDGLTHYYFTPKTKRAANDAAKARAAAATKVAAAPRKVAKTTKTAKKRAA